MIDAERMDQCVRCGKCLSVCPTYFEAIEEMDSPRGRIHIMRLLAEGRIDLTHSALRHLDLCLDCRACEAVCPAGVEYGYLIEHARETIERLDRRPWTERIFRNWVVKRLLPYAGRLDVAFIPVRIYQFLRMDRWFGKILPRSLRDMVEFVPPIPSKRYREELPEVLPAEGEKRGRVGLLTGCIGSILFSPVTYATARVLARNGYEVVIPREQGCCGSLLYHAGMAGEAKRLARHLVRVFSRFRLDAIISDAAGCGSYLKHYGDVFSQDPEISHAAAEFAGKVNDIHEFLDPEDLRGALGYVDLRVAYDDACHLCHAQGIKKQPRRLLDAIPGVRLVPYPEADVCCGSAGIYNMTEPEMSMALLDRKMNFLAKLDADCIATGNPGCYLQLAKGVRQRGLSMEVVHPVELLWRSYQAAG